MPLYEYRCEKCVETKVERIYPLAGKLDRIKENCEVCKAVTDFSSIVSSAYVPFRVKRGRDFYYSETRKKMDKHWKQRVTEKKQEKDQNG